MQAFNLLRGPKSMPGVDSPIEVKESEGASSVLSHRIRDLENRAKSRGESQE
uniref:Uncharacterized protein n=1 Tax=Arundo donax TaxID=35708 RepID=A0A0A9DI37_ARUDO